MLCHAGHFKILEMPADALAGSCTGMPCHAYSTEPYMPSCFTSNAPPQAHADPLPASALTHRLLVYLQEIVPVTLPGRKGQQPIVVDLDEAPAKFKRDRMEQLTPAFADGQNSGTVTPGNASPITDGAAAMVLTSAAKAQQLGLKACIAPAPCLQAVLVNCTRRLWPAPTPCPCS